MFHLIHWKLISHWEQSYIDTGTFGIQVVYDGVQHEWTFFLAPQIDLNNQAIRYFAFDDCSEQDRYEKVLKIQWVGGKTAHQLACLPVDELKTAIETFDIKYFQSIKWIGPKTAKRILVEMKNTLGDSDLTKLNGDSKVAKNIIASLTGLGYSKTAIQVLLPTCPYVIDKEHMSEVMKWLVDSL